MSVNWLGLKQKKKRNKWSMNTFLTAKPQPIPFLSGKSNSGPRKGPMFFPFVNKKSNKKYGDLDFDGSPNKFDCSPRHPGKDGYMDKMIKEMKEDKYVTIKGKEDRTKADLDYRKKSLDKFKDELAGELPIKTATREAAKKTWKRTKQVVDYADKVYSPINKFARTMGLTRPKNPRLAAKQSRVISSRIKGIANLLGVTGADALLTGRRGRPRQSYKYYIPGRGKVGVYEWRAWVADQKRLQKAKLKQMEQMQSQYAQQASPQQQQVYQQPQQQPMPQEVQQVQTQEYQAPQQMLTQQYPSQYQQPQQMYTQEQVAQMIAKTKRGAVKESILNAKNVFSAEAQAQSNNKNILQAPNIMRGEMIDTAADVGPGQGPMEISRNEYYDIDPMSGKPFLKRRIEEKWATGEAL